MAFGTDESVLFVEVSLIQRCPDREIPLYIYVCIYVYTSVIGGIVVLCFMGSLVMSTSFIT